MNKNFEKHIIEAMDNKGIYWDPDMKILSYFNKDPFNENYCYVPVSHSYSLHMTKRHMGNEYELIGISIFYLEYLLNDWTFVENLFERDFVPLQEIITRIWTYLDIEQREETVEYHKQAVEYVIRHNPVISKPMMGIIFLDHIDHSRLTKH